MSPRGGGAPPQQLKYWVGLGKLHPLPPTRFSRPCRGTADWPGDWHWNWYW